MSVVKMNIATSTRRLLALVLAVGPLTLAAAAYAAAPGITGPTFYLIAQPASVSQPDGQAVYSWGYGCDPAHAPSGYAPAAMAPPAGGCPVMQIPGPTLIVTEGDHVTVNLKNALPSAAGNTSILFPGFNVTATGGVAGLLAQEAAPGGTVSYTFVAR